MATYLALAQFTDQGIRKVKDTTERAQAARQAAGKYKVEMKAIYWTLGQYDMAVIIEAADEKAATAFGLAVCSAGNIRMQTLRAFDANEMSDILGLMG